MSLRKSLKMSIQARLGLATILSVVSFTVIVLILLVSFVQVRSDIAQLVDQQLQQTVENSRVSRELAQFLVRLRALEITFYADDDYLQTEGAALQQLLQHVGVGHGRHGQELEEIQQPLREKLADYLQQCAVVNQQLAWQSRLDKEIDETFVLLDEIIAERMIKASLRGEDGGYYEQLILLSSGYRINLLEIARLNAEEVRQGRLKAFSYEPALASKVLSKLRLRLRALTVSEYPIDRIGRHLVSQVDYFQFLLERYQQELIFLGRHLTELQQITDQVLSEIEKHDRQNEAAARRVTAEIDQTVLGVGIVVLLLLIALGTLLGMIHRNLFKNHIQKPLETIRQRLLSFRQGDYSSQMPLAREDEWGEIEAVFNDMLANLVQGWSALQESERRYRDIFESATEGIYQSTQEGKFLNINPAMAEMFGVDSNKEQIATFDNLREQIYANPEDRDRLIEKLLQEETVDAFETQMRRADGEIFWASINGHLIRGEDGQVLFIEGTVNDISQRRLAEDTLRTLQDYLRNIVDSMPSVMIGITSELKVMLWNRRAEEVTGLSLPQVEGRPLAEVFKLIKPDIYLARMAESLKTGKPARLRKVPGEWQQQTRYFDLLIYPLLTDEVSGLAIHIDDVTDRTQIEDVMVQSEKMLSIGGLAAGMAHEINNPLAAVLQNAQVMIRRLSPALDKNRQTAEELGITIEQIESYARLRGLDQMLGSITSAGQRAARIVENMLSFSRSNPTQFSLCSLTDLMEKTIELAASDYDMRHRYDFRTITIVRDYGQVPDVPCEPSQIQQVLLNLLKNAAQALDNKQDKPQIIVRISVQGEHACLQVEDNGPGMDEATQKRIFEPFYTTQEVGQGPGLGLSVAYFIATENHKGSLSVTSEPGQGSCFRLLLPLKNR